MKKTFMFILLITILVWPCIGGAADNGKKVLFIDSYHEGYAWSDGITEGVKKGLDSSVELKIFRMDSKRNPDEDFKKEAALKAKALIEEFKPDVVIAADDNASKYLIEPYYKGGTLPVVFCGVNWDATIYGFPTDNITGMLEVTPIDGLLAQLNKFAKGPRIGFLGPDNETGHKEAENYKKVFGLKLVEYYAQDADDWMKGFAELQGSADVLIIDSDGGLYKDREAELAAFVIKNTKIPTGTTYDFMSPYAIVTYAKVAAEQGYWAAEAAMQILKGKSAKDIPVAKNQQGVLIINSKIIEASGLEVPYEIIETAETVI